MPVLTMPTYPTPTSLFIEREVWGAGHRSG